MKEQIKALENELAEKNVLKKELEKKLEIIKTGENIYGKGISILLCAGVALLSIIPLGILFNINVLSAFGVALLSAYIPHCTQYKYEKYFRKNLSKKIKERYPQRKSEAINETFYKKIELAKVNRDIYVLENTINLLRASEEVEYEPTMNVVDSNLSDKYNELIKKSNKQLVMDICNDSLFGTFPFFQRFMYMLMELVLYTIIILIPFAVTVTPQIVSSSVSESIMNVLPLFSGLTFHVIEHAKGEKRIKKLIKEAYEEYEISKKDLSNRESFGIASSITLSYDLINTKKELEKEKIKYDIKEDDLSFELDVDNFKLDNEITRKRLK